ncbi:MAG: lipase family protein [Bradyrhizobiaceae bacterium]|nr:lipase family protein [Bradyrhizobiaceae bacterium]
MSFLVELPLSEYCKDAFAQFDPAVGCKQGNALAMAWMSQLAYETRLPEKIRAIGELWQLGETRIVQQPAKSTLPLSDTRGIITSKGEALIIAFAGTDPLHLLNWVSNFYLGQRNAEAHAGFRDAAAAVWPQIGAAIESCLQERRLLFVTGHSLGAAIALASVDRAQCEKGLDTAQVFVFGAPRVGRADFVTRYNAAFGLTTYRLVHGKDIVPTVPPSELGFHHVGRYLSCGSGTKFDLTKLLAGSDSDEPSSGSGFFNGVADRLRNLFGTPSATSRVDALGRLTLLLAPSIGDHLPDRYYTALTP